MRIGKSRRPVKAQFIGSRSSRGWQASTSVLALVLAGGLAMPAPAHADDWLGTVSNDWFNAGNWSAGVPTGAGTAVVINTDTPNPAVLNGGVATVGNVTISTSADASLVVSGGGKLNSSNNGIVGDGFGHTGTATVTGAGSTWNSNGMLGVGSSGTGVLTVSARGVVSAAAVNIANDAGSAGTVTVDGATLTSTGNLLVGSRGTGTLMVSNGGEVGSVDGVIGSAISSTSSATVAGTGSTWTNSGDLTVADSGRGTLNITGGGAVSSFIARVGAQAGSIGAVTIDGPGSKWTNGSILRIGDYGAGTLSILNGGALSNSNAIIADEDGSISTATVDGAGSTWTSSTALVVGRSGDATLTIANGGAVSNDTGIVADGFSSTSIATVTGAGSTWTNSGDLTVGNHGNGTLNITSGGVVSSVIASVGAQAGSIGAVTIDGPGSKWTNGSILRIGDYGAGTLSILNGGALSNSNAIIADEDGSISTATVDGAGSTWTSSTALVVGRSGDATLTIANGGAVSNDTGIVADGFSSTSIATVTGAGSTWTNSGDLTVGNHGNGTLSILNGGSVTNFIGTIGLQANSNSSATIDGAGSTWTNSSDLIVGQGGIGGLTISNGGKVSSDFGYLGKNATGSGTAVVHGAGSAWTSTGDLLVGDLGTGGLNILNGGSVSNMIGSIGNQTGSNGTVLVDGAGSTWTNSTQLFVGAVGTGALTVSNGGDVTNTGGYIGAGATGMGTATVTGAGSTWVNSGTLIVGGNGTGTLTISNGGMVSALGGLTIAGDAAAKGTLNIGGAEGAAATAAGVLSTTGVQFGAGDGKLNFNHTNTTYQFDAPISGAGRINHVAGRTVLTGNSSGFTGTTDITGGLLLVNGTLAGTTTVMSGGSLGGSGALDDAVAVHSGGTLQGIQGQTLGLGSLSLGAGSNVNVALGAPGSAGLFNVTGNLTLDGTLNVSNAGGFGAGVYRIFNYGGTLTDNGMAVGNLPLGTTGTVQTAVANRVNLLVSGTTLDTQFWNGTTTTADGIIHGGSGVWTAGPATNWTDVNGATASAWTGNFAVFQNNPGAVTVDTSAGAVSTTGMQFMGYGWTVAGDPITLNGAGGATTIRVGDGTAAGANDVATIGSELTGASKLVKDDLGMLVLTGGNTYTGGTTINAGWLQIGNGGTTGSIQGDVVNDSLLVFNRSDVLNFSGAISGSGRISQFGTGRTVLSGNSGGFTGLTYVDRGTLQVDGTLGGTTAVMSGGTLGGSGSLTGAVSVANGATLLGVQGQTLNMGSLALSGGSNVNVALGAPGGAGLFNVAGNLTLDGTLNVSDAGGFGVGVYRIFDYGGALTNNGLDLGLMPTGTTGTVQTSVANKVNLVVHGTGPGSVQFWNGTTTTADGTVHGGSGVWTAGPTTNWTDAGGAQAHAWGGNFAVFQNNPGTVTVDGSAGAVAATGMQFIGQGWMVSGSPITLNGAGGSTTIRVGDGTAAGAADIALIRSELTGASRLVKDDLGMLVLTGANSYTGGTAINAGILQIGDGGTTGSILGNVANNGLLAFNRSDATTFGGVITGSGAVDVRSGIVSFTADNGYTGPTTIFNAELRLGNGGTSGSVVGNIANNGKLSFNRSNELVYGGVISGNGAIDHLTGRTVLTGNSSGFTGTTDVIGGQLVVNGSLGGALSVLSGGTLGGSGTVGNLLVAGTVAPGNSIGTLNVNGNIGFAAGSIYQVEANAAGQADKIVATGTATLNGGTVQVLAGTGNYAPATAYTILSATGGVTGTFTGGVTSNLAFLDPTLSYDATNVYLTLTRNNIDFASVGLTPNQIAAGGGAESLGFGNPIYNAVLNLSDTQAQYAFDQLSGEIHASARTALIEDSRFVRNAAIDRLRAAFDGVGASGTPVMTYGADGKPRTAAANTDGGAFWGQGFGSWGHTNSDGNAARLERSTGGFLMGADGPAFDTWRFGAVVGYSYTDFNGKDRHSSGSSDNFHLGLYGGSQWGDLAFRSGLAYTWHDIHTSRTISFPGFSDSTRGGYSAGTFQAFGELGYKVRAGAVQFEPFANLAYVSLNTDGFRETGGAAALTGTSATTDATFTTLGLRASTSFDLGGATATAKGMVGWRHAYGDTTPLAGMAFASGGDSFSIGGVPIARDAAVFETGLDIALSPTATVGVNYGGQFGSGVSDQSVKANFRLKF